MSVIIILFFVVHCFAVPSVALVWGQYTIKQAFLGSEGHPSFRYPWKGMQPESEHKIIGFI